MTNAGRVRVETRPQVKNLPHYLRTIDISPTLCQPHSFTSISFNTKSLLGGNTDESKR